MAGGEERQAGRLCSARPSPAQPPSPLPRRRGGSRGGESTASKEAEAGWRRKWGTQTGERSTRTHLPCTGLAPLPPPPPQLPPCPGEPYSEAGGAAGKALMGRGEINAESSRQIAPFHFDKPRMILEANEKGSPYSSKQASWGRDIFLSSFCFGKIWYSST